ncbi:cell death abnormality protein 1-like [Hyposmocoma kahamanoa]|uniref:cell death abnormality protein 1-like n=1 Tax=Hyposmocoma kahamanoa TaxID=1477025 RepID=UPI000E6D9B80|nr:cell death abnormality protein 1-like [Hyposmocoma kahamanoa]
MVFRCLSLYLFVSLTLYDVDCQICQERQLYTYTATELRWKTVVEQYSTTCWWGGKCTKTRQRYVPTEGLVTKQNWRTVEVCCEGYTHEDSEDELGGEDTPICSPICEPSCVNGYCQSPDVCACNGGYITNPSNLFHCTPYCPGDCEHGECTAPNICECLHGYARINGTCQPICTTACINGKCVAPDTCECSEGYQSENGICKPYCEFCGTGSHCTSPGECTCDENYEYINDSCNPICISSCNGGTCVAPNTCECSAGYELNNGTCTPLCPSCEHGHCEIPFECTCDTGYVLELGDNFEFSCQLNCTVDCGNGKCIAPNVCACDSGYILKESCVPTCCEPYCSKGCKFGTCMAPEFCECDSGYIIGLNTFECVPKCDYDCGRGKCVAPNICHCDYGYGQNETAEFIDEPMCKPICKNCEGTCVAPYECVCDPNYVAINVTEDGGKCDCFINCNNIISIECQKTICHEIVQIKKKYPLLGEQSTYPTMNLRTTTNGEFTSTFDFTTEQYLVTTEMEFPSSSVIESSTKFILVENKSLQEGQSANKKSSSLVWIFYVVAAVFILLVIIALAVILIKKMGYVSGGSYVVENKHVTESSQNDFDLVVR